MRERAYGPYQYGKRWRVAFIGATGTRSMESFTSFDEARAARDAANAEAGARTLGGAVIDYLTSVEVADATRETMRHRLTALLRLSENGLRSLTNITPAMAAKLYRTRCGEVKPDTHHGELSVTNHFFTDCIRRGYLTVNPFADVKRVGRKSAGKPQLRVNEVRRFLSVTLNEQSAVSTGVLMALMMGLRAHEVLERVVRDVDNNGRLLWVTKSKTPAGVRQVRIPEVLIPRVLELCRGKGPADRLLPHSRHALHYHTVRLSKLSGVPRVTTHGLRGTFASLAVATTGGAMTTLIRDFGHGDDGGTLRRHYLAPGVEQSAHVATFEALVND